jgi:hypothetical protein
MSSDSDSPDPIDQAKKVTEALGAIIQTAGNDPKAKTAASELGKTAVTLAKLVNVVLLPIEAVTFAVDKAREYFQSKFATEVSEVTKDIPIDEVVEPKPSLAGPLLQSLAFSLDEPDLKEMYLRLLATGMDRRYRETAHPSYVEIIKQLTGHEARHLRRFLSFGSHPIAEIRLRDRNVHWFDPFIGRTSISWQVLETHLLNLTNKSDVPVEGKGRAAMVDNWVRLGLAEASYSIRAAGPNPYDWIELRPELIRLKSLHAASKLWVVHGLLRRTQFGKEFGEAIGASDRELKK